MIEEERSGHLIAARELDTKEWYSWINLMGSPYYEFHLIGEIYLPRYPETMPRLAPSPSREPASDPRILLLELRFQQKPMTSSRSFAWKAVRYDEAVLNRTYETVQVRYEGIVIIDVPVEQVR